jgi:hypothetical protein
MASKRSTLPDRVVRIEDASQPCDKISADPKMLIGSKIWPLWLARRGSLIRSDRNWYAS